MNQSCCMRHFQKTGIWVCCQTYNHRQRYRGASIVSNMDMLLHKFQ
jgi:hypothetical protein